MDDASVLMQLVGVWVRFKEATEDCERGTICWCRGVVRDPWQPPKLQLMFDPDSFSDYPALEILPFLEPVGAEQTPHGLQ